MSAQINISKPIGCSQAATCRAWRPHGARPMAPAAQQLLAAQLRPQSISRHPARRVALRAPSVVVRAQKDLSSLPPDTLPPDFDELAADVREALQGTSLYLVGMMGSGKSTVGKIVARALQYSFFDTDKLIEQVTSTTIPEIFEKEGEEAFREVETQVLHELMPFKEVVVATGGGAVTRAANWMHMQHGIVLWLCGSPQLLAGRVVGDGTGNRPLLSQGEQAGAHSDEYEKAVVRLTKLMEERRKQYEFSDIQVSLEGGDDPEKGAPVGLVAYRVLDAIRHRIKSDAEMREERKNFTIEYDELPPTMKVIQSPVKQDPHLP